MMFMLFTHMLLCGASIFGNDYGGDFQRCNKLWPLDRIGSQQLLRTKFCHFKTWKVSEMQKLGEAKQ